MLSITEYSGFWGCIKTVKMLRQKPTDLDLYRFLKKIYQSSTGQRICNEYLILRTDTNIAMSKCVKI